MTTDATRPEPDDLARLFLGDSMLGLSSGDLLRRFVDRRDPRAFDELARRLGPMVWGTCRRMLDRRIDAEDAFQATFLVLVRRAGGIKRPDLVAPWAHAVAVKVCRKARGRSRLRLGREAPSAEAIEGAEGRELGPIADLDYRETLGLIDDELARLPESHRRLLVLCDLEGLTREQAADRLGWTPNMVRGRLARARANLRGRLIRRGCVPPGDPTLAPSVSRGVPVPPLLLSTAARLAATAASPSARLALASSASASTLALSDGVSRPMLALAAWKLAAGPLAAAGTLALAVGSSAILPPPQDPDPARGKTLLAAPKPPQGPDAPAPGVKATSGPPNALADQLKRQVEIARRRYESTKAFYDEGRVTVDRIIAADRDLLAAELAEAKTPRDRRATLGVHDKRLARMLEREREELKVGRSTQPDVDELEAARLDVSIAITRDLAGESPPPRPGEPTAAPRVAGGPPMDPVFAGPRPPDSAAFAGLKPPPGASLPDLLKDRVGSARRRYDSARASFGGGKDNLDRLLSAERGWAEAESAAFWTADERRKNLEGRVARLDEVFEFLNSRYRQGPGQATPEEIEDALAALIDARIKLAYDLQEFPPAPAPAPAPASDPPASPAPNPPAGPGQAPNLPAMADPLDRLRPPADVPLDDLMRRRVEAARRRYESADESFRVGRLAFDRVLAADRDLLAAELAAASTPEARRELLQGRVARLGETLDRVNAALQSTGRGSFNDVEDALAELIGARIAVAKLGESELAPAPAPAPAADPAAEVAAPKDPAPVARPAELADLLKARAEAARKRYEVARGSYDEGRIGVDRLLAADRDWMEADLAGSRTPGARRAAINAHVDRLAKLLDREKEEMKLGRSTLADVAEVDASLADARVALAREQPAPGATDLRNNLIGAARKVFDDLERAYAMAADDPKVSVGDFVWASEALRDAERAVDDSPEGRRKADAAHVDRLRKHVDRLDARANAGRGSRVDAAIARVALLKAEAEAEPRAPTAPADR